MLKKLQKLKTLEKKRSKKNWKWWIDVPGNDGHGRWKKSKRKTKTSYAD